MNPSTVTPGRTIDPTRLLETYSRIRNDSEALCKPLQIEDYVIQVEPFVSPPKWHLAHTSWFFETLLLKPHLAGYEEFHPMYGILFNSYYDTIGVYHPRPERGLLSRPTVEEVYRYRSYVDENMKLLLANGSHERFDEIGSFTLLGLNHEQQHQELFLTDLKYNFGYNPLRPVYAGSEKGAEGSESPLRWIDFDGGVKEVGFAGDGFAYDNEGPRHKVWLDDFRLGSRPVTNGEYLAFIEDGGYTIPALWLSDGWKAVRQNGWEAPLYWEKKGDLWWNMTLHGMAPLNGAEPVCHVSFYEAMAYAKWAGKRLPTESEWEIGAETVPVDGNFRESGLLHPRASQDPSRLDQMFGDVWEWTESPYVSYPGYRQQAGPPGEYNGKFMSGQMVLRGGSCATPSDHIRSTYRNFFYPHERWQFCGFRLAEEGK